MNWNWNSNTLAAWCKELTHLKRPWCWERLKAGGEGDDRGWDGWVASPTQWAWGWVNSGRWWWTGRPSVLEVTKHRTQLSDWTELNCSMNAAEDNTWMNEHGSVSMTHFFLRKPPRGYFWPSVCTFPTIDLEEQKVMIIFRMDNQQGPTVKHRELYSMLCAPWMGV